MIVFREGPSGCYVAALADRGREAAEDFCARRAAADGLARRGRVLCPCGVLEGAAWGVTVADLMKAGRAAGGR